MQAFLLLKMRKAMNTKVTFFALSRKKQKLTHDIDKEKKADKESILTSFKYVYNKSFKYAYNKLFFSGKVSEPALSFI